MNDQQQPDPLPHTFCQICGRAVASDAERFAGQAYPCGLCNEVKLAQPASTGYVYPGVDPSTSSGTSTGGSIPAGNTPPGAAGPIPPIGFPPRDVPNPSLAAVLGLIPGVGAMYNGQYAKGIVHLLIFAVLASLADTNGIFGFLCFGWVCYQAIEAHHTARARRHGTPLPNPFGLNDIGERMGFGKAWPSYAGSSTQASAPGFAGGAVPQGPANADQGTEFYGSSPVAPPYQPSASNWGAPWESYRYAPPIPPIPPVPPHFGTSYTRVNTGFDGNDFVAFDPAIAGFDPLNPVPVRGPRSRFPAGAIWLIALGTLFLLNTSGIVHGLNFRLLLPLLFIGLGIWSFVWRMTATGRGLADDGTAGYRYRVFRAARGSVWLILLGVIFFLADFHILSWGRSWPLFLILAGIMTFAERAVSTAAVQSSYGYPPANPPYTQPSAESQETTRVVPSTPSAEGR